MSTGTEVTLTLGQAVYWPASPTGYAQVAELRRRNVGLVYRVGRRGTVRRPVVPAARVAELLDRCPLLVPLHNPFDRGCLRRSRTYVIHAPPPMNLDITYCLAVFLVPRAGDRPAREFAARRRAYWRANPDKRVRCFVVWSLAFITTALMTAYWGRAARPGMEWVALAAERYRARRAAR